MSRTTSMHQGPAPERGRETAETLQTAAMLHITLHRHLPEGFTRCAPAFYCLNIIIKIEELVHRQPGPDSAEYSADMARSIRHILGLLGPSALDCHLVKTMRRGAPLFSLSMALEEAFKAWANSNSHHLSSSEWRLVRASPMTLSQD